MNKLKKIEEMIDKVMCKERPLLVRELKRVNHKKKDGSDYEKSVDRLLQKSVASAARVAARKEKIPHITYIPELPITDKKDEIIAALKQHRVVIIAGETGSGKTTQIPKFCIAAGRGAAGTIGCTQPRRIAAINVAARIAEELGVGRSSDDGNSGDGSSGKIWEGGAESEGSAVRGADGKLSGNGSLQTVGYKIRFDDTSAPDTIIKVMTDGILLAETQRDPFLNEYDTIIVDEAHERSLNIDFTLGILRDLIRKRDDLKLVITSATIDTQKFSRAFDDAPVIEVSGRMYPVEVRYMPVQGYDDPEQDDQGYVEASVEAVETIQRESRYGDILIFMPTEQDITETVELLRGRSWPGVAVMPLYARLSAAEQAKIFHRGPGRKIIVSTNVAETSLTIPGIRYVIDTGLARIPHYSPRTRTTALPVTPISRSSADQRKGRCGRVENGICIRLYDEENYNSRAQFTSPEILRSNLAEVILRMISLNLGDVSAFPFIDMPSPKSVKDGFDTLLELGAIVQERGGQGAKMSEIQREGADGKNGSESSLTGNHPGRLRGRKRAKGKKTARGYLLTEKGGIMARIPVDPKLSRILIEADERGCLEEAAIIASALSISDPRQRPQEKARQADQKHALFKDPASDFISLLNIWNACHGGKIGSGTIEDNSSETESSSSRRESNSTRGQSTLKSRTSARKFCKEHYLSFRRIREWGDIHRQIISVLREHGITGRNRVEFTTGTKGLKAKEYDIGGEFYTQLHKSILSGYLGNIAHKKEKNIYHAAKGQKAMIFPGSSIFGKGGNWIVAAEYVETSLLFARTAATIDVDWLEELGKELLTFTWSSPHWEKKRGEVVANEQVSLFGLVVVQQRPVAYGGINPVEAGEIFIRHALVEGEIEMKFPFMVHNQRLIQELQKLEEKTRKRDILITEEDIYLFYQKRVDRDFYNIKTFAKYLKDKRDDSFLCMTLEDLRQKSVDEEHLAGFPDTIKLGDARFRLEYDFKPGAETDGVTIKIPAVSAGHVMGSQVEPAIEWLVPGLFREKVMALIRNLPKSHRVKLLPVAEKAEIISKEIQHRGRPLFHELSAFVKDKFNADIPPSAWSDEGLDPHLKMRISIRDDEDKEIAASRSRKMLQEYTDPSLLQGDCFEKAKKRWEQEEIRSWDFTASLGCDTLPGSIRVDEAAPDSSGHLPSLSVELFPALTWEKSQVALRLFRTEQMAQHHHREGVRNLFIICYESDINGLKKDIKNAARLKGYSSFFGGVDRLNQALFGAITEHLFSHDIRDRDSFESHAAVVIPKLYSTGQELITRVTELCEEYDCTKSVLKNISLKNRNREQLLNLMERLEQNLVELVPPDFLQIYPYDRVPALKRYVAAIRVRAERAVVDPLRDQKRWGEVLKYLELFEAICGDWQEEPPALSREFSLSGEQRASGRWSILNRCSHSSGYWSKEKAEAVETLFWMIEEYKVSLFAQELKTAVKISPRRLDAICEEIRRMI